MLTGGGYEVKEGHALVTAGLRVSDPSQAVQLEPNSVAPLSPVHVVSEGEYELQHPPETFTSLNFLARLQDGQYFWFDLVVPDVELFLVMQSSQSLFVVCYPGKRVSRSRGKTLIVPTWITRTRICQHEPSDQFHPRAHQAELSPRVTE